MSITGSARIKWFCFAAMTLIALSSIAFSWVVYNFVAMVMYDTNLEAFQHALSPEQKEGIISSARHLMAPVILLLIITNLAWIVGVAVALLQKRRSEEHESTSDDA